MTIVEMIVGRCHVGDSDRKVIRYVISRLTDGRRTFRAMTRKDRKALLRQIIDAHTANQKLYHHVMTGNRVLAGR